MAHYHRPRVIRHRNSGYEPWTQQPDYYLSCTICGFPLDAIRTTETPTLGLPSLTVTGTRYTLNPGEEWSDAIDRQTVSNYARYTQCPFCGSGSPFSGHGPEGLSI